MIIANPVSKRNNPFGADINHIYIINKTTQYEYKKITKGDIGKKIIKHLQ